MMNQDIKKRWLEALRSGKYTQGVSVLHSDGRFCVMGVLCDILKEDVGGVWDFVPANGTFFWRVGGDSVRKWCGHRVRERSGIESFCVRVPLSHDPRLSKLDADEYQDVDIRGEALLSLGFLNDLGFTFAELADLIEVQL